MARSKAVQRIERLIEPSSGLCIAINENDWDAERQPCEGARLYEIMKIDWRTTDDPKKVPVHLGKDDWWYGEGTNHRIENGMIRRDLGWEKVWCVYIFDIAEFARKYGECKVSVRLDGFVEIRFSGKEANL